MYRERLEILENWKGYVRRVAVAAVTLLEGCEVYAFGSIISGRRTAASDIDVLVMAESLPDALMERAKVKEDVEKLAGLPPYHPIQIHLVTKDETRHSSIYSKAVREGQKLT
ncbi:MAG: nucleotidyltransferase domain-containing protein [Candidatus Bathyarchaeia archaeon]